MTTLAACTAANSFLTWVQQEEVRWAENPSDKDRLPNQPRFSCYEEAHRAWLVSGNGLDLAACDYGLTVAILLEILVRLDDDRPINMPLVESPQDNWRWDHMTESGFRQLVYRWQRSPHRLLSDVVLSKN
jgi:hypothetical protein